MRYIELTAEVAAADAERACDALRDITGESPWIEHAFTQPDFESDAIRAPGATLVRVYVRSSEQAADARERIAAQPFIGDITIRDVAAEDWAEAWKEYFHTARFGERIVVVPTWRSHEPRPGDVVVTLDPGMAFGTGQHETTRMCLEAVEQHVRRGVTVLDVGCGSGILAIAAAKLGAADVVALDVDDDCVRITAENARQNDVGAIVRSFSGSADASPLATPLAGRFDVVVANIIARVIIDLAQHLVDALAPDGRLIASGIIGERERETRDALIAVGARVEHVRSMGEWRCIEAVRG